MLGRMGRILRSIRRMCGEGSREEMTFFLSGKESAEGEGVGDVGAAFLDHQGAYPPVRCTAVLHEPEGTKGGRGTATEGLGSYVAFVPTTTAPRDEHRMAV